MILHPKLKTKYFQQNKWSKKWIDTALDLTKEEWARYKALGTHVMPLISSPNVTDDFGDISMADIDDLDKLDVYLLQPLE
ncbi:hypothetical protein H0H92_012356 [Tricholoma furcatifolium]|nr:hypothetical protein H0H92_012356 [Tricholoma furcatifolium]